MLSLGMEITQQSLYCCFSQSPAHISIQYKWWNRTFCGICMLIFVILTIIYLFYCMYLCTCKQKYSILFTPVSYLLCSSTGLGNLMEP